MCAKMRDTLLDKATDGLLNLVFDKSKDEIIAVIDSNKRQRILLRCMTKFTESDYFKNEFRDVVYIENNELISSITDDELNVSLTVGTIHKNILPKVEQCFVAQDEEIIQRISNYLAQYYILNAKTTATIFDVINNQHQNFDEINFNVDGIKKILKQENYKQVQLEILDFLRN